MKVPPSLYPTNSWADRKKKSVLDQQIELLAGKLTLAWWTKVLSQTLIHLSDQPLGAIGSQVPNIVKVWKTEGSCSPGACHGPTSYDNKGTKTYCPWYKDHLIESAMG